MKIIFLILLLVLSITDIEAKTKSKKSKKTAKAPAAKINYEDAKEHCLISKGASISNTELENCIQGIMKSKIKQKDLAI